VGTNALLSACTSGKCALSCEPGFANCDGKGSTGCETNLNDRATCGASCETVLGCPASKPVCASGTCVEPPSCQGLPKTCGGARSDDCCKNFQVGGGSYSRGVINPGTATVGDFRLDIFEITVARFRKFVSAWVAGYRPKAGDGKHTHLNGGQGLVTVAGGYESGWITSWASNIGSTGAEWDTNLACESSGTWTAGNDDLPMGCTNWWEMVAFCIWDGGFLPSEAEWEWAAGGREARRPYPWGTDAPVTPPVGTNPTLAAYACLYDSKGSPTQVCSIDSLARPGVFGAGMSPSGHYDLAGNVGEWMLDHHGPYPPTCVNCVQRTFNTATIARGGTFAGPVDYLSTKHRGAIETESRYVGHGARCARLP
jgi:formylglycine-generating enzyme required for sulfatase activity